jgi:uncharacterized repeat protein (TIGR02543 family)
VTLGYKNASDSYKKSNGLQFYDNGRNSYSTWNSWTLNNKYDNLWNQLRYDDWTPPTDAGYRSLTSHIPSKFDGDELDLLVVGQNPVCVVVKENPESTGGTIYNDSSYVRFEGDFLSVRYADPPDSLQPTNGTKINAGSSFQGSWRDTAADLWAYEAGEKVRITYYEYQISTDSTFTYDVKTYNTSSLSTDKQDAYPKTAPYAIPSSDLGKVHYWRVRASNSRDASSWSSTMNFEALPNAPSPPVASAATSITSSDFWANWNSVGNAMGYRMDVSTTNAFTIFVSGYNNLDVGDMTNKKVTGLNPGITYYYRIRAYNSGGTSGNSGTISATTSANSYTVSYNANGATGGTAPASQTKTQNATLTLAGNSGNLAKTGYTFAGWNTAANGSGTDYAAGGSFTDNSSIVLYAKWTVVQSTYTVSYNANGGIGTAPASQTKTNNVALTLAGNSGNLAKTGYTFAGWNTAANGSGTDYAAGGSYTANAPVTLYAKWNATTYPDLIITNVSYTAGTYQPGDLFSVTGTEKNQGSVFAPPTFYGQAVLAPSKIWGSPSNILIGQFVEDEGLGAGEPYTSTYSTNLPNRPGSYYLGIMIDIGSNVVESIEDNNIWWSASPDIVIQSPAQTYTVSYNANGATGTAPGSQTKTNNVTLTLAGNSGSLAKTGYTFSGWNTAANGSGTNYAAGGNYTANAAVTLYAKWTLITYTVAYNGNGSTGGSTASSSHTYDVSKVLTANGFTRTGYTFAGWATTAGGTAAYSDGQSVVSLSSTQSATVTLYAKWIPITYALTVNTGTGGGPYASGTRVAISATVPAGKQFYRWLGSTQYVDSVTSAETYVTMPAFAITLTATNKPIAMPWLNLLLD